MGAIWKIYGIRYTVQPSRPAHRTFLFGEPDEETGGLDYYSWVLRNVPPKDAPRDQMAFAMTRIEAFLRRYGEKLHESDGMSLFRLRRLPAHAGRDSAAGP